MRECHRMTSVCCNSHPQHGVCVCRCVCLCVCRVGRRVCVASAVLLMMAILRRLPQRSQHTRRDNEGTKRRNKETPGQDDTRYVAIIGAVSLSLPAPPLCRIVFPSPPSLMRVRAIPQRQRCRQRKEIIVRLSPSLPPLTTPLFHHAASSYQR